MLLCCNLKSGLKQLHKIIFFPRISEVIKPKILSSVGHNTSTQYLIFSVFIEQENTIS